MKFFRCSLFSVLLFCTCPLTFSQTDFGFSPFSSVDSGLYDSVKIATGSVALALPVRSKPGFNYSLVLNDGVSSFQGGALIDPTWAVNVRHGVRPINNSGLFLDTRADFTTDTTVNCPGTTNQTDKLTGWYFIDGAGATHLFPAVRVDTMACLTESLRGVASDGSGYLLTVSADGSSATVYDASGYKYYNSSKASTEFNAVADPNGNILYFTGGCTANCSNFGNSTFTYTYADPLGTTPITQIQTYTNYFLSNEIHAWKDAVGGTRSYTVKYSQYTVMTKFGCSNPYADKPSVTKWLPNSITAPDGTYLITYEATPGGGGVTGRLAKIVFPSGAYITYAYAGGNNNSGLVCPLLGGALVPTLTRTIVDTNGNSRQWKYDTQSVTNSTVVTDPSGNDTVYLFSMNGSLRTDYETQRQAYQGHRGGTPLKTDLTCYNNNTNISSCATATITGQILEKDVYTTLAGMPSSSRVWQSFDLYGNLTETKAYGFGDTIPTTDTVIGYGTYSNGTCTSIGNNIVNRVCSVTSSDGSGHPTSQTNNTYDPKGNLTSTSLWVKGPIGSGGAYLTSSTSYNPNGTVNIATAINGAQTFYNYDGSCKGLVPTSISEPMGLSKSATWDCNGGVITSIIDENQNPTHVNYVNGSVADPFYRALSIVDPLGNTTSFGYTPTTSESTMNFNGTASTSDSLVTTDGFGHTLLSQTRQAQGSSTFDTIQYTYDANGRLYSTSVPCSAAAGVGCTTSTATNTYDGLSRPLATTDGGGATFNRSYPQNDVLTVLGPAPPPPENLKSRQNEYDGLGRLTSVCELTSSSNGGYPCGQTNSNTGYWTRYGYDAMGRLIGVCQNTTQPLSVDCVQNPSAGQQTRIYAYDGLGRLSSENNPESGIKTYIYDAATTTCGSGTAPGNLVETIDNAGAHICLGVDALNRVNHSVIVSGGNWTNDRWYIYGDTPYTPPAGITINYGKNRVVEAYVDLKNNGTKDVDEWFSYDANGQMTDMWEYTPNSKVYYHTTVSHYPNGVPNTLSGLPGYSTLTYSPIDGEGRWYGATLGTTTVVSGVTYDAAGNPKNVNIGSGTDQDQYSYDAIERMSQYQFFVGSLNNKGILTWNQNGTLGSLAITDGFNSNDTQNCIFGYDDLARLTSDACGSLWSQTYSYDQYGNLSKSGTASFACPGCYNPSTNQFQTMGTTYDADGNLTYDGAGNHYTWDGYGKMATVNGATVTYDAFGRAVAGPSGEILYTPLGKVGLLQSATRFYNAYVPLPGGGAMSLGCCSSDNIWYLHRDWIGTSRAISEVPTSGNGGLINDRSFSPFGDVYQNTGFNDPLFFAGMNSDLFSTSGTGSVVYDTPNRELAANASRWLSPDPAGLGSVNPSNPQTWNRYAYVNGQPLTSIDPTGLACFVVDDCGGSSGWTGGNYFGGGSCDPVGDAACVFDVLTPWYTNRQGGQSGFSFGFDVAPGFGGGGGIWSEWQGPLPTSPGQVLQSLLPTIKMPGWILDAGKGTCANTDSSNLNYFQVNNYAEGPGTASNHIQFRHINPLGAFFLSPPGQYETRPPQSRAGMWDQVQFYNAMTREMGTQDGDGSNGGSIVFTYTFPMIPYDPSDWSNGGIAWIGRNQVGQPTGTNKLVLAGDCKTVITSYPL